MGNCLHQLLRGLPRHVDQGSGLAAWYLEGEQLERSGGEYRGDSKCESKKGMCECPMFSESGFNASSRGADGGPLQLATVATQQRSREQMLGRENDDAV